MTGISAAARNSAGIAALFACIAACAQSYPVRPIRVIVPFVPGGNTDIIARAVTARMAEGLGPQMVIDNRGGAGGMVGTEAIAKAAPDGYTIGIVSASHVFNPALHSKLPYDTLRDFTALGLVADVPTLLAVHPSVPAKSVKELIVLARRTPLNYASAGVGTVGHLSAELLKSRGKFDMTHIPYKGSGQAISDLVGGQIPVMFASIPVMIAHVQAGKIRPLGVTSAKRSQALPEVPTIAEQGFPGYEVSSGFGMIGPAGLPRPVVERLNGELARALKLPDVRERFASQGAEPMGGTPEQHDAFIRAEVAKWIKVVKDAGIRAE